MDIDIVGQTPLFETQMRSNGRLRNVVYNCPYAQGVGAIRWIVASWRDGFERRGFTFHTCEDSAALPALCDRLQPEILYCDIVSTPIEDADFREFLARLRAQGTRVCMNVFWPLSGQPEARARALREHDVADLYCGEREPDSMESFERDTGKVYMTMPQSANPRFHFPGDKDPRFDFDIAFVGAKLPHKRWFNDNVLLPLTRHYRVGLFGPNWTLKDNSLRALSKAARLADWPAAARWFDKSRVSIGDDDERRLYSTARISLNFHEREPDNTQPHHIVNQRTFKIAACGGFQIVDPVKGLRNYFVPGEEVVVAALDPSDWHQKIEYYLANEEERQAIQRRATQRAIAQHMAPNRVDLLCTQLAVPRGTSS